MARYEHSGAAADAHLVGDIASGTSTAFTLDVATDWPTGAVEKFWVAFEPDTANEEHALVNARVGTALSLASSADRGLEGTVAQRHPSGSVVRHIWSAMEADDIALQSAANAFTAQQVVSPAGSAATAVVINPGAGQTGDLLSLQVNGTGVANVTSGGVVHAVGGESLFGAGAFGGTGTRVGIGDGGDPANAFVKATGSPTDVGLILQPKGGGIVNIRHDTGTPWVEFDGSGELGAGLQTSSMQLRVNNTLKRVSCGAADSGGAGNRVLIVPN